MRGLRRHRNRKQVKIVLCMAICLLTIMTVGYAAFSTNIGINAKGNLKYQSTSHLQSPKICGNGELVEDSTIAGRYIYRGADPCNYITLGSDNYRIIAVETDGTLKVVRENSIGQIVWDPGYSTEISGITSSSSNTGTRYSSTETDFCYTSATYYGCKSWGSGNSTLDYNSSNVNSMPWDTGNTAKLLPTNNSYINAYLNGGTYAGVSIMGWINGLSYNDLIEEHIFNVGPVDNLTGQTLNNQVSHSSAYKWLGKVGLVDVIDWAKANSNVTECGSVTLASAEENANTCKATNWLYKNDTQWTMSPVSTKNSSNLVWYVSVDGNIKDNHGAYYAKNIRPVFYLSSDINLAGSGTSTSPYTIAPSSS